MDLAPLFQDVGDLPARTDSAVASQLKSSAILKIAGEVQQMIAAGIPVANFTVGDFSPDQFRVPDALTQQVTAAYEAGSTNYPSAIGVPELRSAIREFYAQHLGLNYPEGTVQVGSGARPPIYAAFQCIVSPGDTVLYQVPSWNIRYYVQLSQARGVVLQAQAEQGFMLTASDILPHLHQARLLVINSPQNPSGTVISERALREICEAIVAENDRRAELGERPLMLLYDQVYWQLTFGQAAHYNPVSLVPEMAKYTILVDAISKCWAATGVRVGWCMAPPWVRDRMKAYVGHMGAWASRPAQLATAAVLRDPDTLKTYMPAIRADIQARLQRLADAFDRMQAAGLPVHAMQPEGAIYLTVRFDLHGKTVDGQVIDSDEAMRSAILQKAGTAIVPFTAFGYPDGSGWVRFSVGAVGLDDIDGSLQRIESFLNSLA